MDAEIFPDFQLHTVDFRQKTRCRSVVVFGIRFNVAQVRDLPLECRDSVKRNVQFLIVCNHDSFRCDFDDATFGAIAFDLPVFDRSLFATDGSHATHPADACAEVILRSAVIDE